MQKNLSYVNQFDTNKARGKINFERDIKSLKDEIHCKQLVSKVVDFKLTLRIEKKIKQEYLKIDNIDQDHLKKDPQFQHYNLWIYQFENSKTFGPLMDDICYDLHGQNALSQDFASPEYWWKA